MEDLIAFVRARLDEDEASAKVVHDVARCDALLYEEDMADAARRDPDCDCGMPARVLREVAAGRAIMMRYKTACRQADVAAINGGGAEQESWEKIAGALELDVRSLAAIWSDHPDYRDEWKP